MWINEQPVPPRIQTLNHQVADLGAALKPGLNTIRIQIGSGWTGFWTQPRPRLDLILGRSETAATAWSVTQLGLPQPDIHWVPFATLTATPTYYSTQFAMPSGNAHARFHMGNLGKGEIWLNGRSIGRFWSIGPQEWYKLPASWLEATNTLVVLDEEGGDPRACLIEAVETVL